MDKKFCDRCDAAFTKKDKEELSSRRYGDSKVRMPFFAGSYPIAMDICSKCQSSFEDWLKLK